MNKRWSSMLLLGALAAAMPLIADEATERRLGEIASESGDFKNAEVYFTNALTFAENSRDAEAWAADALRLGEIKVRLGDVAGARELLTEFRKRNPARSAGLLPGLILIAEDKPAEAEVFLDALVRNAPNEPENAEAAKYLLGMMKLRQKDYRSAMLRFNALAASQDPRWRELGIRGRIHTLIRQREITAAEEALTEAEGGTDPHLQALTLFAEAISGKLAAFPKGFEEFRKNFTPRPDQLISDLLLMVASEAEKSDLPAVAEFAYANAFSYASSKSEREEILLREINFFAPRSPEQAVATILRYVDLFPSSPKNPELLLQGARLMAGSGDFQRADTLFMRVVSDNSADMKLRRLAALDAATSAEQAEDYSTTQKMFDFLEQTAPDAYEKQQAIMRSGEFRMRRREYDAAASLFARALTEADGTASELANFRLLQALTAAERFEEARVPAERAAASRNREYADFGLFQLANFADREGRSAEARERYLKFISDADPKNELIPAARFAAAENAFKSGMFSEAGDEFQAFSDQYPESPESPCALHYALESACIVGDGEKALALVELFARRHPRSPERSAALLSLSEWLAARQEFTRALELLAVVEAGDRDPANLADAALQRAKIAATRGSRDEALGILRDLLGKYPGTPTAADAALLAGSLSFELGKFDAALEFYRRAQQLRPTGIFGEIASGRIADTLFVLSPDTPKSDQLSGAVALYSRLVKEAVLPEVRLQSAFKLGRCLEQSGKTDDAVQAYEQALYFALEQQQQQLNPDPLWYAPAATAAVRLIVADKLADGEHRAMRIIRQLEELSPSLAPEAARLAASVDKAYNNQ